MDFRGYLNKIGAKDLLAFTGNDAKIDPSKAGYDIYSPTTIGAGANGVSTLNTSKSRANIQSAVDTLYKQYLGGQSGQVLQPGASYSAPAPVYAPKLDIAGLNARARSSAENAVNPYYTKALNDYLANEAQQRTIKQQQTDTALKNAEDALKLTQEGNATTGARTAEDVATNLGQINQQADQFQTDSGTAFDASRIAEARRAALAGTTGGTAAASSEALGAKNATDEARQTEVFQQHRDQQELFKSRTFEDIATSNKNAGDATEKAKTAANFDLDTFIKNQAADESNKRNDLEASRLQSIQENTQSQQGLLFSQYLANIADPAKYLAAIQTYGGLF